jgi:hypothetical protein
VICAALLAAACSGARYSTREELNPGVTVPTPIAEGKRGEPTLPRRTPVDAGAQVRAVSTLPDPQPLRINRQWQYDILYERGRLRVVRVEGLRFPRPVVTAREMGRYAIELWIGAELVERVRFDFPLLGAEDPSATNERGALKQTPSLAATTTVTRRVLVPASPRATRALLIDRATGDSQPLPWPPDAPLAAVRLTEHASEPPDSGRD